LIITCLIAWHVGIGWWHSRAAEQQCRTDLSTIRFALQHFAAQRQFYPEHLQALVDSGFLTTLPRNPYWHAGDHGPASEFMQEAPPGEHSPGSIGYIASGGPQSGGYLLVVYGDDRAQRAGRTLSGCPVALTASLASQARQIDWDHALYMLDAGGGPHGGGPTVSRRDFAAQSGEDGISVGQPAVARFSLGGASWR
jgi:hypothetical protein